MGSQSGQPLLSDRHDRLPGGPRAADPLHRAWHPSRGEWGWYGVYFLLSALAAGLAQLPAQAAVRAIAVPDPVLALWAEAPLALLLGSLGSYVVHRLGHTNRWLWRLHGVHHVPDKVNVANNGVNHVLDVFLAQAVVQLSLALVGFSAESVFVVGLFIVAQGYFIHANIDVRIGWLNYLLATPEQHRLHHSTRLSEAGHYGYDLSLLDLAFGSFTWRPGRKPAAVGLHDPRRSRGPAPSSPPSSTPGAVRPRPAGSPPDPQAIRIVSRSATPAPNRRIRR